MRPFGLVRASRLRKAEARITVIKAKYARVWQDHLKRCDCHDAWDQCPCSEIPGHHTPCDCCEWCG